MFVVRWVDVDAENFNRRALMLGRWRVGTVGVGVMDAGGIVGYSAHVSLPGMNSDLGVDFPTMAEAEQRVLRAVNVWMKGAIEVTGEDG